MSKFKTLFHQILIYLIQHVFNLIIRRLLFIQRHFLEFVKISSILTTPVFDFIPYRNYIISYSIASHKHTLSSYF